MHNRVYCIDLKRTMVVVRGGGGWKKRKKRGRSDEK